MQPRIPRLVSQMKSTVHSEDAWQTSFSAAFDDEAKKFSDAGPLELTCKILDNKVYAFVEWARDSTFFDSLDVSSISERLNSASDLNLLFFLQYEDQKKLLQFGWNSYLMFDFVYHLSANIIPDQLKLQSGGVLKTLELASLGHSSNASAIQTIIDTVRELGMNRADYLNVKMILLLNPCKSRVLTIFTKEKCPSKDKCVIKNERDDPPPATFFHVRK